MRTLIEVADIFRTAGPAYRSSHAGHPKPRGWTMPSYRRTVAMLEHLSDGCAELFGEIKTGKLVTEQSIEARIRQLVA